MFKGKYPEESIKKLLMFFFFFKKENTRKNPRIDQAMAKIYAKFTRLKQEAFVAVNGRPRDERDDRNKR